MTLPIEAVLTLDVCWRCRGEGREYYCDGRDGYTGDVIEYSCVCESCCGMGATPVLAGWDDDSEPPEDDEDGYDPADAPMFVEAR